MRVEQISVFLENKAGRLAEATGVLAAAGVSIRALSLADTSDFGVLRLIVGDREKATKALKEAGFTVNKTAVVAVEVEDRPGGLHRILSLLDGAGLNVEYMYAFVRKSGDTAVMIFRFDDPDAAARVLTDRGVSVIDGGRLYGM
ncbi:MAG: ACT domain-containing protein [Deltaproteobacteria bacterium]|nr:ACT domain-containing protein [Deltaproteobacteria bacterium]